MSTYDLNQQYATANSTATQSQSPTGQAFLANLSKYGQAGVDSWNSNPQSFSINDFNRIAQTNPVMAEQMLAAGGQNYRNAVMGANGWDNNKMNTFINTYGSGALPGFKGYTGAGAGVAGGSAGAAGAGSPGQAAGAYGAGYTGYGGSQLNGPSNGTGAGAATGAVMGSNFTGGTGNYGAPAIPAGLYDPWNQKSTGMWTPGNGGAATTTPTAPAGTPTPARRVAYTPPNPVAPTPTAPVGTPTVARRTPYGVSTPYTTTNRVTN